MPIYEYQCLGCEHEFETIQKMSEAPLIQCPSCGKDLLRKKISAVAFRLKGGGWYETDFKSGDKKNVASGSESNGEPSSKESSNSESKGDAKPGGSAEPKGSSSASEGAAKEKPGAAGKSSSEGDKKSSKSGASSGSRQSDTKSAGSDKSSKK